MVINVGALKSRKCCISWVRYSCCCWSKRNKLVRLCETCLLTDEEEVGALSFLKAGQLCQNFYRFLSRWRYVARCSVCVEQLDLIWVLRLLELVLIQIRLPLTDRATRIGTSSGICNLKGGLTDGDYWVDLAVKLVKRLYALFTLQWCRIGWQDRDIYTQGCFVKMLITVTVAERTAILRLRFLRRTRLFRNWCLWSNWKANFLLRCLS